MSKLTFVPAKAAHIRAIAGKMRDIDVATSLASGDASALAGLTRTFRKSSMRITALLDGVPVIMFGVEDINVLGGVGAPWIVPTFDADACTVAFVRFSRPWFSQLSARYSILRGVADRENHRAIRWLSWLGFSFVASFSAGGRDFLLIEKVS